VGGFAPAVLMISGCQNNQIAMDGDHNGVFTEHLLKLWNIGNFNGSYSSSTRRSARRCRRPIRPTSSRWGRLRHSSRKSNSLYDERSHSDLHSTSMPVSAVSAFHFARSALESRPAVQACHRRTHSPVAAIAWAFPAAPVFSAPQHFGIEPFDDGQRHAELRLKHVPGHHLKVVDALLNDGTA